MHKCQHSDCPAIFSERAEMALHFLDHHSLVAEANKKKHEQRIRLALDNHGIDYVYQFKIQNRNAAGEIADKHYANDLHVDFLITTESEDIVVLEVDQLQHKSYGVKNECQRMKSITSLLRQNQICKPNSAIIWLRYNPDSYNEGSKRYVGVDAVHEAEPCLVRYVSSLQGGVVDVDGGVAKRENNMEIIYLRYNKECSTSNVPRIVSHMDFFPEFVPFVRTFDLSECAVLVQTDIVKQEIDADMQDENVECKRLKLDNFEQDTEVDAVEVEEHKIECKELQLAICEKHNDLHFIERDGTSVSKLLESKISLLKFSSEIIADCINIATQETNLNFTKRILDGQHAICLDRLCVYLNLKGKYATSTIRKSYSTYSKSYGLKNYKLLKKSPKVNTGQSNVAFVPAKDILGFLRQRTYPTAIELVKRIDDEIAKRTQEIQIGAAKQQLTSETARADKAEHLVAEAKAAQLQAEKEKNVAVLAQLKAEKERDAALSKF